jgi:predicted RNase H-like HicB family nuclease
MKATFTSTISFPIDVKKENRYHLASCPVLDVWAYGKTQQGAVNNLKETLQVFLAYCFEHGTLEMVLKGCGFTTLKRALCQNSTHPINEIDVPLPFVIDQSLSN